MLVRMPAINTPERQKNSYVVEAKTKEEADALVAQGGEIVTKAELKEEKVEEEKAAAAAENLVEEKPETTAAPPKGKGHK